MLKIILIILILVVGFIVLWLNRSSDKIPEVLVTIFAALLLALFYITKDEQIKKSFAVAYFTDVNQANLLTFYKERVISQYYTYQTPIYSKYLQRLESLNIKPTWDLNNDLKPLIDLQAISILSQISTLFSNTWYIDYKSYELPNFDIEQTSPKEGILNISDIAYFDKSSLSKPLAVNIFSNDLEIFRLALPKDTIISYEYIAKPIPQSKLRFYKPAPSVLFVFGNLFDIVITTSAHGTSVGLGTLGDYLGITDFERKSTDINDPNIKSFRNVNLEVICTAKFNRWLSSNPDVLKYKEWTAFLFNNLYQKFDWGICYKKMLDYEHTLANKKTIKDKQISNVKN